MKLTKKAQYGILFALYLGNAGRATIETAALNLRLSKSFLEQVARTLRLTGVVKSVKGPHGGYELTGSPTVGEVLSALSPVSLLDKGDYVELRAGGVEQRAFALYIKNLNKAIQYFLSARVRDLSPQVAVSELNRLDGAEANA